MKNIFFLMLLSCTSTYASDREKQIRQFVTDELKHSPEALLTNLCNQYFN